MAVTLSPRSNLAWYVCKNSKTDDYQRQANITKAYLHLHSSICKLHLMRWIRGMLYFSGSLESVGLAPDLNFDWNSSVCAQLDQHLCYVVLLI